MNAPMLFVIAKLRAPGSGLLLDVVGDKRVAR